MNPLEASTASRAPAVDVRDQLAGALQDLAGRDVLGVISLPAPHALAEALLDAGDEAAVLWAPPGGPELSGTGEARVLVAAGPDRFRRIREQARSERLVRLGSPGSPPPLWFGGFAFQTGGLDATWNDFGEARFAVPRWRYALADGRAWLDLAVHGLEVDSAGARQRWVFELGRLLKLLGPASDNPGDRPAALVSVEQGRPADYETLVSAIVAGIREGRFEKVVAARRAVLELDPAPDPRTLLTRLSVQAPGCTRFAFRVGARTFLGATPEQLVEKRGLDIETEALAGSIRAGSPEQALLLGGSRKDLGEHELVVRAIVGCLEPLCSALDHPPEPEIRALRHVLHLCTPIRGRLASERHVLELVEALHPTPAVGGVPSEAAQRWIAGHEPAARGWYSGPVGCFDENGDGQFAVALRSGFFTGPRVHLYAGAGIVRDSDPASEYAETRLKLRSLLSALGVDA